MLDTGFGIEGRILHTLSESFLVTNTVLPLRLVSGVWRYTLSLVVMPPKHIIRVTVEGASSLIKPSDETTAPAETSTAACDKP